MSGIAVRRGFADTSGGQIHYATCGNGKPVLFLHQTPRSWDEYSEVLPIVGKKYHAIAMDTIGFGDSYRPETRCSIESYACGVIDFLDAMSIDRTSIVGHHTGGVIALEVAASFPQRIERLILSSTPFLDAEERERRKSRPPIDEVHVRDDGSHLTELWQRRMPFYPANRPDLLRRFIIDALRTAERVEEGHQAVSKYRMEEKATLIQTPTLVLAGTEDPFSYPHAKNLGRAIKGAQVAELPGGMVPMVDQMPERFAGAVLDFLSAVTETENAGTGSASSS
ncbi:MAG: alpha/beta hydrolase [Desulfomonile tiedjei]|uniref:Alpha/beta hydrolase n=1 Tax=Desulfomonile tiedjei TaxID=2358 RepID=A0A9D6Z2H9_9BACT|nr:alpha/beta hydrolase [Desulfomonile tiedjei]